MERTVISTPSAPKAIGPYSQAIKVHTGGAGALLFCSGQIPIDPTTGELVGASDVRVQAKRVMENIAAVLAAGGSSFDAIVKTTIFLADMGDFAAVNEVYGAYFKGTPPARSTIQVAGLPKAALVEIEIVAIAG